MILVQTTVSLHSRKTVIMPHFSRLTDIVTCNLTEILETSIDPATTLLEILAEMDQGLAACSRSVKTSSGNYERISREIALHNAQIGHWIREARQHLTSGDEVAARESLTRKVELEGLVAGLKPEMEAAYATWQHMLRIQRALEARHSDASRRLAEITGQHPDRDPDPEFSVKDQDTTTAKEVDAALEALKKELLG